ncbi:MAG: hypothetical protein RIS47_95 [Bacteroidota bacterium]
MEKNLIMNITTKHTFESAIVESLIQQGNYTQGNAPDYSPELGDVQIRGNCISARNTA